MHCTILKFIRFVLLIIKLRYVLLIIFIMHDVPTSLRKRHNSKNNSLNVHIVISDAV